MEAGHCNQEQQVGKRTKRVRCGSVVSALALRFNHSNNPASIGLIHFFSLAITRRP
jgi:hypothetical protein